ncbi:MAG: hypothetical protein QOH59_348 [Gemmatimonadales bacterium]|nr:hypothetical protein [Gemmatimonadales bacterium]
MSIIRYGLRLLALGAVHALGAQELSAQSQIISLAAAKAGELIVTIQSGAVQTIAGVTDNALNAFPAPIVINTDWNVKANQTNTLNLVAYFTLPAQAMVGGTTQIPSSRLQGRMATGLPTSFTAFTQNGLGGVGTVGGSLRLFSVNVTNGNRRDDRTDNLDLRLNLVGFPPLAAGSYTGTLNIRAVTQ